MKYDDSNSTIEIVLASDERYFVGLLVTATSIARHLRNDASIAFTILDGGISQSSKEELESTVKRFHSASSIRYLTIDKSQFVGLPNMSGSVMTYARLLLPQLMPNTDFALYLDVDFLCHADIAELWEMRDCKYVLQSTLETFSPTHEKERLWANEHSAVYSNKGYFCAGLSLFNLKAFREQKLDWYVLNFLSQHNDVNYYDQSALNFALAEKGARVELLPHKWQVFSHEIVNDDISKDYIIHFAGNTPWANVSVITDAEILWFKELAIIRGISLWEALRLIHSPFRIFFGRFIFKMLTCNSFVLRFVRKVLLKKGLVSSAALLRPLKF